MALDGVAAAAAAAANALWETLRADLGVLAADLVETVPNLPELALTAITSAEGDDLDLFLGELATAVACPTATLHPQHAAQVYDAAFSRMLAASGGGGAGSSFGTRRASTSVSEAASPGHHHAALGLVWACLSGGSRFVLSAGGSKVASAVAHFQARLSALAAATKAGVDATTPAFGNELLLVAGGLHRAVLACVTVGLTPNPKETVAAAVAKAKKVLRKLSDRVESSTPWVYHRLRHTVDALAVLETALTVGLPNGVVGREAETLEAAVAALVRLTSGYPWTEVRDTLRAGLVLHFRLAKKSLDEFGEYPRHAWYWRWQEIDRLALHLVASAGLGSAPGGDANVAAAAAVEGLVHYVDRVAADLDHGSTEFLVGVADTLLMCALAVDPPDAQEPSAGLVAVAAMARLFDTIKQKGLRYVLLHNLHSVAVGARTEALRTAAADAIEELRLSRVGKNVIAGQAAKALSKFLGAIGEDDDEENPAFWRAPHAAAALVAPYALPLAIQGAARRSVEQQVAARLLQSFRRSHMGLVTGLGMALARLGHLDGVSNKAVFAAAKAALDAHLQAMPQPTQLAGFPLLTAAVVDAAARLKAFALGDLRTRLEEQALTLIQDAASAFAAKLLAVEAACLAVAGLGRWPVALASPGDAETHPLRLAAQHAIAVLDELEGVVSDGTAALMALDWEADGALAGTPLLLEDAIAIARAANEAYKSGGDPRRASEELGRAVALFTRVLELGIDGEASVFIWRGSTRVNQARALLRCEHACGADGSCESLNVAEALVAAAGTDFDEAGRRGTPVFPATLVKRLQTLAHVHLARFDAHAVLMGQRTGRDRNSPSAAGGAHLEATAAALLQAELLARMAEGDDSDAMAGAAWERRLCQRLSTLVCACSDDTDGIEPPVHVAAELDLARVATYLVHRDRGRLSRSYHGFLPLHRAAASDSGAVIAALWPIMPASLRGARTCDASEMTALQLATAAGAINAALALLDGQAELSAAGLEASEANRSLLRDAVAHGLLPVVARLLDLFQPGVGDAPATDDTTSTRAFGPNLTFGSCLTTPLMVACGHGHVAVIELLLDRGASPEMETAVGETCLDFALRAEASAAFLIRTCPELLEARSHGRAAVHRVVRRNQADSLATLLRHTDVETALACAEATNDKSLPIHCAADHGAKQALVTIISFAAGRGTEREVLDALDFQGRTALHIAAIRGNACVDILCGRGAAVAVKDANNMAPVHYACQKGNLEALRTLLDYGRESVLELTGHTDGKTPLHLACTQPDPAIVSELLLRGANVNAKTEYGYPPLNYAARGFFDAARLLVENSADLRAKDANHRKPAYYAADHPMLAQFLRDASKSRHCSLRMTPFDALIPEHRAFVTTVLDAMAARVGRGGEANESEANELTEPGITLRVLPDNGMGLPTLPPLVGLPEGQVGSTALYFQVTKEVGRELVIRKMRRVHHKLRRDEVSEVASYRLCLEDRRGPSEALVDFVFALADAKQAVTRRASMDSRRGSQPDLAASGGSTAGRVAYSETPLVGDTTERSATAIAGRDGYGGYDSDFAAADAAGVIKFIVNHWGEVEDNDLAAFDRLPDFGCALALACADRIRLADLIDAWFANFRQNELDDTVLLHQRICREMGRADPDMAVVQAAIAYRVEEVAAAAAQASDDLMRQPETQELLARNLTDHTQAYLEAKMRDTLYGVIHDGLERGNLSAVAVIAFCGQPDDETAVPSVWRHSRLLSSQWARTYWVLESLGAVADPSLYPPPPLSRNPLRSRLEDLAVHLQPLRPPNDDGNAAPVTGLAVDDLAPEVTVAVEAARTVLAATNPLATDAELAASLDVLEEAVVRTAEREMRRLLFRVFIGESGALVVDTLVYNRLLAEWVALVADAANALFSRPRREARRVMNHLLAAPVVDL